MNRDDKMAGCAPQEPPAVLAPITKLKLDLKITGVTSGVATFTLEGKDAASKPHVKDKKIIIPERSRDVIIEFDLDDNGFDLEFCEADPIWVSRTEACPQRSCSDDQIFDIRVPGGKLTISDRNTDEVELGYTIVLEGGVGRVLADPIIKNQP